MADAATQLDGMVRRAKAGGPLPGNGELGAVVRACLEAAARADTAPRAASQACYALVIGVSSRELGGAVVYAICASPRGFFQLADALRLDARTAAEVAALRVRVEARPYAGVRYRAAATNWQQNDRANDTLNRVRATFNAAVVLSNILLQRVWRLPPGRRRSDIKRMPW